MKTGLIIANTGSPASPDPQDVRAYLKEFLSNRRIVPMNPLLWKLVLNRKVLPKRTLVSGEKYAMLWEDGEFPFIRDHRVLARKLEESFQADGVDMRVRSAMSFGEPSIPAAMKNLYEAGCRKLCILPLYPQNAFSQAGVVQDAVEANMSATGWSSADVSIVGDYSSNEAYLHAIAASVRQSGFGSKADDRIVFCFHSIPVRDVQNGDGYERAVNATCNWLAGDLGLSDGTWALAYQSRFDKEREWLNPFVKDVLNGWQHEGFDGRAFIVCPNFSVDCLETRYDIEGVCKTVWLGQRVNEGKPIYRDSFVYIPCLGSTDAHVEVIKDIIEKQADIL